MIPILLALLLLVPHHHTKTVLLTAHPDSSFKFISLQLETWTDAKGDEHKAVRSSYAAPINGNVVYHVDEVNEKDGTYKAHKLSDEEARSWLEFAKAQMRTQPEKPQFDESDIPPQHQHPVASDGVWTTNAQDQGTELAPPPDGCPCEGQECSGTVIAFEGTKTAIGGTQLTRTTLAGSWVRFVNNLQRCQWKSTGGTGYYSGSSSGSHWVVNTQIPPHQEGPHAWGPIPGHWDMTATGAYKSSDFCAILNCVGTTLSEDSLTAMYDTQGSPPMVINGYHSDSGGGSFLVNGYGGSTTVSSCGQ